MSILAYQSNSAKFQTGFGIEMLRNVNASRSWAFKFVTLASCGRRYQQRRFIKKAFTSLLLVAAFSNGAECASLELTDDGKVIFEALGDRMSLRLGDFRDRLSFKDDLRISPTDCVNSLFPYLSEQEKQVAAYSAVSRKGFLDQDQLTKCIWDKIRADKPPTGDNESYIYTFFVDFIEKDGLAFPGGVPEVELPKDPRGNIPRQISFDLIAQNLAKDRLFGLTFGALANDASAYTNTVKIFSRDEWPQHPCKPQAQPGAIKFGFEDRGPVILEDKRVWGGDNNQEVVIKQMWSNSTQFFLPSEKRLGNVAAPLCVICGAFISSQECHIYLWSSDKAVRFELRWSAGQKPSPSADWITADFAARKIAHSIFIDRPENDFQ